MRTSFISINNMDIAVTNYTIINPPHPLPTSVILFQQLVTNITINFVQKVHHYIHMTPIQIQLHHNHLTINNGYLQMYRSKIHNLFLKLYNRVKLLLPVMVVTLKAIPMVLLHGASPIHNTAYFTKVIVLSQDQNICKTLFEVKWLAFYSIAHINTSM